MSQSQEASANPAEPQPVARSGGEKNGNGRGPQQAAAKSASAQPKQSSQAPTSQKSGTSASQKANGTEASGPPKNSWANIARAGPVNGAAAEKPAAAPAAAQPAAASGVKLPAGVASGSSAQGSIKFGSIGPAELQQQGTQAASAAPAPAAAPAAAKPAAAAPPAPAPSKPVSFAAAASGGTAPKQQAPPAGQQQQQHHQQQRGPGGRNPRAQQPVPASMPQGAGFNSQPMATAFLLSPGAPVAYPQAYMLYNPSVSTQQYFAGGFGQAAGQYPGFNYGTPPQGGNMPAGPRGPQPPVPSMPVPPPPPQVSSGGGAGSGAAAHGSYGNAPSSPLPPRTGTSGTPPPARVKKILRIENPETHEVLNLSAIAASKKPEASTVESAAAAPAKEQPEAEVAASKSFKDVAIRPKSEEAAPEPEKAEEPAKGATKDVKPEVADAKPEIVEKAVVEPEHADATNGEVEDSEESSQFATPLESEEFERPLPDDGRKRYNNTFLLSIAPLCKDLPPQIEMATLSALQWVEDMGEKPLAPPRPPDRDWKSGPRGPPSGMPGGPPGMRGGGGGRGRGRGNPTGIESETWERGKALPPMPGNQYGGRGPPPGMRMPSGPLPALHKTDSAYKIGNVVTDDPEEEKAQKALKSTLNKITPQNFEKIKEQIIAKINERKKAKTLSAFIDQIFDKALVETTFAELYAKLVAGLNPALPELEGDDGTPVQFRRTLLNKCQEEFERGAVAMKAVAEREKRDHEKPAEEPAVEPAVEAPKEAAEVEEGEISLEEQEKLNAAEEAKRQDKAQADAEVKARKRMLGNIIFVGQLYRFGVLTESVMHTCIKQLLEESQNPRSEDIECLCKLLTTVGRPMDGSNRTMKKTDESGEAKPVSTRDLMAAYFIRIDVLSRNEALDSRHRFMLADLIDLRRNNWVLRRATEGPKKIDDIHRDAAMERSRSQMLDRQASRGGRDQRGPPRPFDNRVDAPIRTMNRVGSQEDSLGQSFRPGGRPAPPPRPAPPAGERPPAPPAKPESSEEETAVEAATEASELSAETITSKVKGLLAELYNSKDIKEAVICVNELVEGKADMANVFDNLLTVSLESKDTSWETLNELLEACGEDKVVAQADFEKGARQLLDKLDDLTVDVPKAPAQVGDVLASLLANDLVDLKVIAQHILEADAEPVPEGEESMMVDSGVALKALGATLRGLKTAKGPEETAAAWKATELDYKSYIPAADREDAAVAEKFVSEYELAEVL